MSLTARQIYHQRQRAQIKAGTWGARYVDPAPAVAHLHWLRTMRISSHGVAALTGLSYRVIEKWRGWRPGDPRRMHRTTAELILTARDPLTALPDVMCMSAVGSSRRIRAMQVNGFSLAMQSSQVGMAVANVARIASLVQPIVTAATARTFRDLYNNWYCADGAQKLTKRIARENGWPGPEAWDDTTIDDPATKPYSHLPKTGRVDLNDVVERLALGIPLDVIAADQGVQPAGILRKAERVTDRGGDPTPEHLIRLALGLPAERAS